MKNHGGNLLYVAVFLIFGICLHADSIVVFNEIMYHPSGEADDTLEWVELYNQMSLDMELSGWSIKGIDYTFPTGSVIPGRSYCVVAVSPSALQGQTGYTDAFGPYNGSLSNAGETLKLVDHNGRVMDEVEYNDRGNWPAAADGSGVSLAKIHPDTGSSDPANWTFSAQVGGTVGAENFVHTESSIVITGELNRWHIDMQGDPNHNGVYGQTDPVDMTEADTVWNIFEVHALDASYPGPSSYTPGPINLELLDYQGVDQAVTFTIENDSWGWAGGSGAESSPLLGDYLLILNSFGVDCDPSAWQITGLEANDWYELTYYHSAISGRGIDFTANQVSTSVFGPSGHIASVLVQSDSSGRILGNAAKTGGEGNWAGLMLRHVEVQVTSPNPSADISLAINEIAPTTASPFKVELVNYGDTAVDLDGMVLASSNPSAVDYSLPSQTLNAGGYLSIQPGWTMTENDRVFLYTNGKTSVIDAAIAKMRLRGRFPEGTGDWAYPTAATFGSANIFDFHNEIIINEIMYHAFPQMETEGTPGETQTTTLLPIDADWRYNQTGADLGTNWHQSAHSVDDQNWFEGPALLAKETSALPEPIRTPLTVSSSQIVYYFETEFNYSGNPVDVASLQLQHVVDDSAVFYLNGVELYRFNISAGQLYADSTVNNAVYSTTLNLPADSLLSGTNRLSVEVHQASSTSSDVVFGAVLGVVEEATPPTLGTPFAESDEEWIELYNNSSSTVDLTGWRLDGGIGYDFPPGTNIAPNSYLLIAKDAVALSEKYPALTILGDFSGGLGNAGDSIELKDENGNIADSVAYYDSRPWPSYADGGGSSLERRDVDAESTDPQNWDASDESDKTDWKTYTYRGYPTDQGVGHEIWNEFVMGLLDAGEILLDDISVIRDPDGAAVELIQNGSFETGADTWRLGGNHQCSQVIIDPENPANNVLHLVATGGAEHMLNHIETTLAGNESMNQSVEYEVSYRAKWVVGCNRLNSRFYFCRLPKTMLIDTPQQAGTPGAQNTRYVSNKGPTFTNLKHEPVFPAAGEEVTVTVDASDPDGITDFRLYYAVSGGAWNSVPMSHTNGDTYTGIIPGAGNGSTVQFYIRGRDADGLTESFCPAGGSDSRALYRVGVSANTVNLHEVRILMTAADFSWLDNPVNTVSNDTFGATVIYDGREVFYDARVRYQGSAWGRNNENTKSYCIKFDADHKFRGVHDSITFDRWKDYECFARQLQMDVGDLPTAYADIVNLRSPMGNHDGIALMRMSRYGKLFLDSAFKDGSDNPVSSMDMNYTPTSTIDGNIESPKKTLPFEAHTARNNPDFDDLGPDKEYYRYYYLMKNDRMHDDFGPLVEMMQAYHLPAEQFEEVVESLVDPDNFARQFAFRSLLGDSDAYTIYAGSLLRGHNLRLYENPEDGRFLAMPWDMDGAFTAHSSHPLIGTGTVCRLFELPGYERLYYGHLYDMIESSYHRSRAQVLANRVSKLTYYNYSSRVNYIENRGNYILSQLPAQYSFAVTDPNLVVADAFAAIHGTAWIDMKELYLDGIDEPLELDWTLSGSGTSKQFFFTATVPVEPGVNNLNFRAYDFQNRLIATHSMTVTSTVAERPLRDYLRVTEIMYDPAGGSDEEFIELQNTSGQTLDLTHVTFTDGITFDFGTGSVTNLAAGEYVLVVKDLAAFSSRYNTAGLNIAGEYSGKLSNDGETITLQGQWASKILSLTYADSRGWPLAADGAGHSLVPIYAAIESQADGSADFGPNWRASAYIGGSPGTADPQSPDSVVINEVCAHTDFSSPSYPDHDSNDWIELYNPSGATVTFNSDWYLSDDKENLKKWSIGSESLAAGQWLSFDEIADFHNPITSGFGLDKAGEQVFMSYLPGDENDRVIDCIKFKGQPNGSSLSRVPDGGEFWYETALTRNASNATANPVCVISEFMYHPAAGGKEYIELKNLTASPLMLWDNAPDVNRGWRLDGGISLDFPESTTIPADGFLLLVGFDPNEANLNAFNSFYGTSLTADQVVGPYSGDLSNNTERIALERPQASDDPLNPNDLSWIIVDEAIYFDQAPWPYNTDGTGQSVQRKELENAGNNPQNWQAKIPTQGFWVSQGDLSGDGTVGLEDIDVFAQAWLSETGDINWNPTCDFTEPLGTIDLADFAEFTGFWE